MRKDTVSGLCKTTGARVLKTEVSKRSLVMTGLLALATVLITACPDLIGSTSVAVTGVSLDTTSITIAVNGTATLIATVTPENAVNKALSWTSSDTDMVTVNEDGLVTAVGSTGGSPVTVTVTTAGGQFTASCAVTVSPMAAPVYSIATPEYVWWETIETSVLKGYEEPAPKSVTITNTGNQPTGKLHVELSSDSFILLTGLPISSIDVGSTATFTVGLVPGLQKLHFGRHNANIWVWGDHGIDKTISLEVYVKTPWE